MEEVDDNGDSDEEQEEKEDEEEETKEEAQQGGVEAKAANDRKDEEEVPAAETKQPEAPEPPTEALASLVSMGFDAARARAALLVTQSDVERSTSLLLEGYTEDQLLVLAGRRSRVAAVARPPPSFMLAQAAAAAAAAGLGSDTVGDGAGRAGRWLRVPVPVSSLFGGSGGAALRMVSRAPVPTAVPSMSQSGGGGGVESGSNGNSDGNNSGGSSGSNSGVNGDISNGGPQVAVAAAPPPPTGEASSRPDVSSDQLALFRNMIRSIFSPSLAVNAGAIPSSYSPSSSLQLPSPGPLLSLSPSVSGQIAETGEEKRTTDNAPAAVPTVADTTADRKQEHTGSSGGSGSSNNNNDTLSADDDDDDDDDDVMPPLLSFTDLLRASASTHSSRLLPSRAIDSVSIAAAAATTAPTPIVTSTVASTTPSSLSSLTTATMASSNSSSISQGTCQVTMQVSPRHLQTTALADHFLNNPENLASIIGSVVAATTMGNDTSHSIPAVIPTRAAASMASNDHTGASSDASVTIAAANHNGPHEERISPSSLPEHKEIVSAMPEVPASTSNLTGIDGLALAPTTMPYFAPSAQQTQQQNLLLSDEDHAAIGRLCELGFSEALCRQAYVMCGRSTEAAAAYLCGGGGGDDAHDQDDDNDDAYGDIF